MTTKYTLFAQRQCTVCNGSGRIEPDIVKAVRAGGLMNLTTQAQVDDFGRQFGYRKQSQWPQEQNCEACGAKGWHPEERVNLADALADLGYAPAPEAAKRVYND